jgi:hypothetical protein
VPHYPPNKYLSITNMPLTDVEKAWPRAGSDRRIVFVP